MRYLILIELAALLSMYIVGSKLPDQPRQVIVKVKPSYSADDVYYLSRVLNSECENCIGDKWRLVGSTVINRSREWRMSIRNVVLSADQFDTVNKFKPTRLSIDRAMLLLSNGPTDTKVLYFWNSSADGQEWNKGKEPKYYIDDLRISY